MVQANIVKTSPVSSMVFPNGWQIRQNGADGNVAIFDNTGSLFAELLYNGTNQSMIQIFDPTSTGRWMKMWLVPSSGTTADFHFLTSNGFVNTDSQANFNNPTRMASAFLLVSNAVITTTASLTANSRAWQRCDATAGAFTVTLPPANTEFASGQYIIIMKIDSSANAVTVSRAGSDTIEGGTTKTLSSQYSKTILISDGGNPGIWYDVASGLV